MTLPGERPKGREEAVKSLSLRCAIMIVALSLLASCGGGGGGDGGAASSCTPNGNISLRSSSTGTTPLLSITVIAARNPLVTPVPVYVAYTRPQVAAILAGYPPGTTDHRTIGMNIIPVSLPTDNPQGLPCPLLRPVPRQPMKRHGDSWLLMKEPTWWAARTFR